MKKQTVVLAGAFALCLGLFIPASFAEQAPAQTDVSKKEATPVKLSNKDWVPVKYKEYNKKELQKLKKENPAKFKEIMQERHERVKGKLEELRKKDPERYYKIMQRIREKRKERLEKLRKEDPAKFKELMQKRNVLMQERLQKLKKDNPERYKQLMEQRKRNEEGK